MDDFQQESWVWLYQAVLMELEHEKMLGRIEDARTAIVARIETLRGLPGLHAHERRAIEDAVRTLGFLEREEEKYQGEEKRRAAAKILGKLRSRPYHPAVG